MRKPPASAPIDPIVQRRLDALERVIDTEYDGSVRSFEAKTGIKMAQVSQWFSGYRALRDKALRRLEESTSKPEGYFDGLPADSLDAWPFKKIAVERFLALHSRQQGWIEAKLEALIEECEAESHDGDERALKDAQTPVPSKKGGVYGN